MKITYVNHAGFVIEHAGTAVLCDPWLHGRAFSGSQELVSATRLTRFEGIQYLWLSHEHPDHFSPASILGIPAAVRAEITVLYQRTADGVLRRFCEAAGFRRVLELDPRPFTLGPGFSLLCEHFMGGDSWACFRAGDVVVLNTNDCVLDRDEQLAPIVRRVDRADVLLTKFSYAAWAGNPDQRDVRVKAAQRKLDALERQVRCFRPRFTIPIASQFLFCHEENHYLNDSINTPGDAARRLRERTTTTPIVLQPGDAWSFGEAWDSSGPIAGHRRDLEAKLRRIGEEPGYLGKASPVPLPRLHAAAGPCIARLGSPGRYRSEGFDVHLWDHELALAVHRTEGLHESTTPAQACDVAMSSEMLLMCLEHPERFESVRISGRMRKPPGGDFEAFDGFFRPLAVDEARWAGAAAPTEARAG